MWLARFGAMTDNAVSRWWRRYVDTWREGTQIKRDNDRKREQLAGCPIPRGDEPYGVVCGRCGGDVYMETCRMSNPTDHDWVIASECQSCGLRHPIACPDCDGVL